MARAALLVACCVCVGALRSHEDEQGICDIQEENYKKYGHKLHKELCDEYEGCPWWDDCKPIRGKCPVGCSPWKEGVQKSKILRTYQWAKHKVNGKCSRACRHNDDYMLVPAHAQEFMASSAAFLSVSAPELNERCRGLGSLSCMNLAGEVISVAGLQSRALEKARTLAKQGQKDACRSVLPPVLATDLGESFVHLLKFFGPQHLESKGKVIRKIFQAETFARICNGSAPDVFGKLDMNEGDLAKQILKTSNGTMSAEAAQTRAHEIKTKGLEKVADEVLAKQEEEVSQALVAGGGSLMEVDGQMQGLILGLMGFLMSVLSRIIWTALVGPFYIFFCIVSMGDGLEEDLNLNPLLSPLTCPVFILAGIWGLSPTDENWEMVMSDSGLSWKDIGSAFMD